MGRSVSALHKNLTFEPTLLWDSSKPYKVPPAPQPKTPPPPKPPPPTEYELVDRATQIREEAAALGDGVIARRDSCSESVLRRWRQRIFFGSEIFILL